MEPATPLPWEGVGINWVLRVGAQENERNYYGEIAAHDSWYAKHACNAYPRLVEALRKCISGMPHNPPQDDAIELLRELGELK